MGSKCDNCELFLLLDKERVRWCKILALKNLKLHQKLTEQQELITILKNKLSEKRSSVLSEYVTNLVENTSRFTQNENSLLEKNIKDKLTEVNDFLTAFNSERELFQQEVEEVEKYFSENISYLHGLVDYFRESLFDELDKSNRLKQYFIQKVSHFASNNHNIIIGTLREEEAKLTNELRSRYQKTIQKSKEEIEQQSLLVTKLRKHNKQLYSLIQKSKTENEKKINTLEKNLQDLKTTIKKLKEKNDYLRTQIKLEVEGCQNDIYDARKKIRRLKPH